MRILPILITCVAVFLSASLFGQQKDSLSIKFQIRGHCYAYSNEQYAAPGNGEYQSPNIPKPIPRSFPKEGFYLMLDNQRQLDFEDYQGHPLYLVNASSEPIALDAQDSRLNIVAQALDKKGNWKDISYLPSSWCGNSYHTVTLGAGEYWTFETPVFDGPMKTQIRYVLMMGESKQLVSNPIPAFISPRQMNPKHQQGHTPQGLMDPYND